MPHRLAGRPRVPMVASVAMAATLVAGCDLPTGLPDWETRWVIPAERTRLPVEEILPAEVLVRETNDGFEVTVPEFSASASLGELCGPCAPLDGLTVPKPPFTLSFADSRLLSQGIVSASVSGGALQLHIEHDFPFDPLHPGGAENGYLVTRIRSGGHLVAQDSMGGPNGALPPGRTVVRSIPLPSRIVGGEVEIETMLYSPAGRPATIDLSDRLTLTLPEARIELSDLRIRVDQEVESEPLDLKLEEIDQAVSQRARGATIDLDVSNPFALSGEFTLRISAPGTEIVRPLPLTPGESELLVELSAEEVRALLGRPDVVLRLSGPARTPTEGTTVEPGQAIDIRVRLDLVVGSRRES